MRLLTRDISQVVQAHWAPVAWTTHAEVVSLVAAVPGCFTDACIFRACAVTEIFGFHAFCRAIRPYDQASTIIISMLFRV